jgi:hypothetical protein
MVLRRNVTCDIPQAYLATVAEVFTGFARCCVKRDKSRIEGRLKDAGATGAASRARWIMPCGNASVDQAVAVFAGKIDFGIVDPALFSRFRVDSEHAIEARSEIERCVHQYWCCFKAAALSPAASV